MFSAIHDLQAGSASAEKQVRAITARAEAEGWPEVVRLGLFGAALVSWIGGEGWDAKTVRSLVERCEADDDATLTAVALAIRSVTALSIGDPSFSARSDADLARAAVLLEREDGGALERVTAHTACGIAFAERSLWELADEQYDDALRLGEADVSDEMAGLLAAVVYNRAEVQVGWASSLRQLGERAGVQRRWRTFLAAAARAGDVSMPYRWRCELATLEVLLASIAGEDRSNEARGMLDRLAGDPAPGRRSAGHLRLALALSDAGAGRGSAPEETEAAIDAIDAHSHPHEHELALYLAAELEAVGSTGAGLRCARHQIAARFTTRTLSLGSMRALIRAERMTSEVEILSRHAFLDDLTAVGNRRALERYFAARSERGAKTVAFLMTDIDGFKAVNDRCGHRAGDLVLVRLAEILARIVRPADIVVRLGGDEFAVVLAGVSLETAISRAHSVVESVQQEPWEDVGVDVPISLSIGLSVGPPNDVDRLLNDADRALYDAKAAGGGQVLARD